MNRSKRQYAAPQKPLPPLTKKNKLPVTKVDVARRHLETAITLWFGDGDPVSIHLLLMAAHEILRALNKIAGGPPMVTEAAAHIRPEYHQAYEELMFQSYQFFKHGGRDPEATEWFGPGRDPFVMVDAVEAYFRIAGEQPPILKVFQAYWRIHQPEIFVEVAELQIQPVMKTWSKLKFFSEMLPAATLRRATPPR